MKTGRGLGTQKERESCQEVALERSQLPLVRNTAGKVTLQGNQANKYPYFSPSLQFLIETSLMATPTWTPEFGRRPVNVVHVGEHLGQKAGLDRVENRPHGASRSYQNNKSLWRMKYNDQETCSKLPQWLSMLRIHLQCRRHRRCMLNSWVGKIPWKRKWPPTLYSCLGNPMERKALWATVQRVAKSQTRLVTEHSTNMLQMLANAVMH